MAKYIHKIDKLTLELCQNYAWPGNIRELQNIVERSMILCIGRTFSIDEAWLSIQRKVAGAKGAAARLGIPLRRESKIKQLKIYTQNF